METETERPEVDARTQRILEHAEAERLTWRGRFGHLPRAERTSAALARRDEYSTELLRLIEAGHFDDPKPPEAKP